MHKSSTIGSAVWAAIRRVARRVLNLGRRARRYVERLPGAGEEFLT